MELYISISEMGETQETQETQGPKLLYILLVPISVCNFLFLGILVFVCVCVCLSVCVSVCVHVCLFVCVCVCLCVCFSLAPSLSLPLCPYACHDGTTTTASAFDTPPLRPCKVTDVGPDAKIVPCDPAHAWLTSIACLFVMMSQTDLVLYWISSVWFDFLGRGVEVTNIC